MSSKISCALPKNWYSFVARSIPLFCCSFPNNPHCHPGDSPDDFRLRWVVEPSHFLMRMRMGNDDQLPPVNLAPTAHVAVSQFGEIRGGEAFDLLQLLNTGHSGTLSTIHANTAKQGHARFTSCVLQSGVDLPYRAIKTNIADSLNIVIQVERRPGRRYISEVLEINGYDPDADLFDYGAIFVAKQDKE
jgi:hypothetical protein